MSETGLSAGSTLSPGAGHVPLVAFTSLAVAGAGLVIAEACFELIVRRGWRPAAAAGAILLSAGLAISLAHLGRKRRAGLAARGTRRSPLSREAMAAAVALASTTVAATLGVAGRATAWAIGIAGVANVLFLLSVGFVYRVRGQRTWQGFSVVTPLTGGIAFGAIAVQSLLMALGLFRVTLLLIAVDALVFSQRWRDVAAVELPDALATDRRWSHRDQWLGARLFLLDVAPFFLFVRWPTPLAAALATALAAAGLVVDRAGFYALAIQHTTEHEVAAVESLISRWR
jgi:DMSO reductase anchor subunit